MPRHCRPFCSASARRDGGCDSPPQGERPNVLTDPWRDRQVRSGRRRPAQVRHRNRWSRARSPGGDPARLGLGGAGGHTRPLALAVLLDRDGRHPGAADACEARAFPEDFPSTGSRRSRPGGPTARAQLHRGGVAPGIGPSTAPRVPVAVATSIALYLAHRGTHPWLRRSAPTTGDTALSERSQRHPAPHAAMTGNPDREPNGILHGSQAEAVGRKRFSGRGSPQQGQR